MLQAFFVTCQRIDGFAAQEFDAWISELLRFECAVGTPNRFLDSVILSRRYQISYWDAAIIVAAQSIGAGVLYTEDLNHRQVYGAVTAINPFA